MDVPGTTTGAYDGAKRHYLTIYSGKLSRSAKEGDQGAVSRINKKEKKVWEVYYESITGILKDVFIHTGDFGDELHIKLAPNAESEVLIQMPFDSKHTMDFLLKLGNIDTIDSVTLRPFNFDDKEKKDKDGKPKKVIGMTVSQTGTKVAKYFTAEKPNGFPFPEIGKDGKFVFLGPDDYKILTLQQKKFLKGYLDMWRAGNTEPVQRQNDPEYTSDLNDPNEKLPF